MDVNEYFTNHLQNYYEIWARDIPEIEFCQLVDASIKALTALAVEAGEESGPILDHIMRHVTDLKADRSWLETRGLPIMRN